MSPRPLRLALVTLVAAVGITAPAAAQDSFRSLSGLIAVHQSRSPGIPEDGVVLVRPDGTFLSTEDYGIGDSPELSPDGTLLATSFFGCIYYTDILLTHVPLFHQSNCRFGGELKEGEATWSPDGRHLAFIGETGTGSDRQWDVYVTNFEKTEVRRITTDGRHKSDPEWRADGRIAFVLHPGGFEPTDIYSVHATAPTGTTPTRETSGTDAKHISFPDTGFGINTSAYIASGNNSRDGDRLIVRGREVLTAPWLTLRGVDWAPGPTPDHLAVSVSQSDGGEVWIVDLGGEVERRLPIRYPGDPDWGVEPRAGAVGTGPAGPDAGSHPTGAPRDPVVPRLAAAPAGERRERRTEVPVGLPSGLTAVRAGRTGKVPLQLGCPDPVDCRVTVAGRIAAAPAGRATAARSRRLRLPRRRYAVPAGTVRRVRYRLPRPARRALRARGRLLARLVVTVKGATTRRDVRTLTVRRDR